jgi:hypothetical protein
LCPYRGLTSPALLVSSLIPARFSGQLKGGDPTGSGKASVGLKAEAGLMEMSKRERLRHTGHNSACFSND